MRTTKTLTYCVRFRKMFSFSHDLRRISLSLFLSLANWHSRTHTHTYTYTHKRCGSFTYTDCHISLRRIVFHNSQVKRYIYRSIHNTYISTPMHACSLLTNTIKCCIANSRRKAEIQIVIMEKSNIQHCSQPVSRTFVLSRHNSRTHTSIRAEPTMLKRREEKTTIAAVAVAAAVAAHTDNIRNWSNISNHSPELDAVRDGV